VGSSECPVNQRVCFEAPQKPWGKCSRRRVLLVKFACATGCSRQENRIGWEEKGGEVGKEERREKEGKSFVGKDVPNDEKCVKLKKLQKMCQK
jgi:hypothetical protein